MILFSEFGPGDSEELKVGVELFDRIVLMLLGSTELLNEDQDKEVEHDVFDKDYVEDHERSCVN